MEDDFKEKTTESNDGLVSNGEKPIRDEPEKVTSEDIKKSEDTEAVQLNGDAYSDKESEDTDSSDHNLVIDENPQKPPKKRKRLGSKSKSGEVGSKSSGFKGFKKLKSHEELEPLTNPYFNESIVELSELHQKINLLYNRKLSNSSSEGTNSSNSKDIEVIEGEANNFVVNPCKKDQNKKNKRTSSPKLREYAQYLGLQPTVQFKCPKCSQSGFPSLAVLNEHRLTCNEQLPQTPSNSLNNPTTPSTNFRVTRKVYLCSACGTYYENWNLFLHMREVHKRFICLYCLGMFSHSEKLSLHLVSKHNCVPNKFTCIEDFFQLHKEPCFLVCCDCEKAFSEQDNFINHTCEPIAHTTTEFKSKYSSVRNNANQKVVNKGSKSAKSKTFVGHVTADSHIDNSNSDDEGKSKENNCLDTELNENVSDKNLSDGAIHEKNEVEKLNDQPNQDKIPTETTKSAGQPFVSNLLNQSVSENSQVIDSYQNQEDSGKPNFNPGDDSEKALTNSNEINRVGSPISNHSIEKEIEEGGSEVENSLEQRKSAEMLSDLQQDLEDSLKSFSEDSQFEDTRRVPKVTLKLPKTVSSYTNSEPEESDDSEKLTLEVELPEENKSSNNDNEKKQSNINDVSIPVAGPDVPVIELELEQPLDKFDLKELLQKCLSTTASTCVYCNHARKIAVNGKQLGLHAIAEHRFSAVVNSITAEELIPESFVSRIKEDLSEIENSYFNLEASTCDEAVTFSHIFECFQCRFSTAVHKELYLHNRKMHAKTILLCIMCKSNFYSYSELICHLCPGIYALDSDVSFRCCMCVSDELPSAFRLMVHLRKRHHACDVCLDLCHNQSKLSNHVWKHKLHHLCYRCGIAYRNKPDITKHLFWKHGTESVLCKKCLQKKWPHVYHFCIPPSTFTCEECNLNFTRAVALKVHKRIHNNEKQHSCSFDNCTENFISKKLLIKHELKHREPPEEPTPRILETEIVQESTAKDEGDSQEVEEKVEEGGPENTEDKPKLKPKVDVYDLPELNLSESDSSDSENEAQKFTKTEIKSPEEKVEEEIDQKEKGEKASEEFKGALNLEVLEQSSSKEPDKIEIQESAPVLENIWDDFKNYQANKEKLENLVSNVNGALDTIVTDKLVEAAENAAKSDKILEEERQSHLLSIINQEHDYCIIEKVNEEQVDENQTSNEIPQNMDHDYCSPREQITMSPTKPPQEPKPPSPIVTKSKTKRDSSSDSSSGSDSSSCSCGSNCSCSSSSGSSSSSSDSSDSDSSTSEGRRKQQARREKAKEKSKNKNKEAKNTTKTDALVGDAQTSPSKTEPPIEESDLETTETETDEDFYDKQPQKIAKELLAKKKEKLLAGIGSFINGSILESSRPSTPSLPETEEVKIKKKSKNKKRKRKNKKHEQEVRRNPNIPSTSYPLHQPPTLPPLTLTLTRNSPLTLTHPSPATPPSSSVPTGDVSSIPPATGSDDSSTRASKRRRVPNKFYGYSSDEEEQKRQPPVLKWRKADLPSQSPKPAPSSPLLVPPITIKTSQPPPPSYDSFPGGTHYVTPQPSRVPPFIRNFTPPQPTVPSTLMQDKDSASDTNESTSEEETPPPITVSPQKQTQQQVPLYCYCRCPYDEVSEMIGCDANDCAIEWFHFECVGIMVPPKGQWFCPDCRKKKQQKKELQV
ncbi:uncharacterized protein LOC108742981 [Agrilus planipennis]|uniref:Uncharacterized protein LOC108742981 n=1 Tax=Agrilus planipennis TaxID=224129 RepID=A0A1W4XCM0_AGRPL|nr:uncharacterized protein LOC108742981 [Agrilus planipennis]XP_018333861.1 uncharacterized protein LOC108742981 [Agrilus planipennis]XP_018333862.1 uncharacterized protein LOC108742981 [Agrilus planipennis]